MSAQWQTRVDVAGFSNSAADRNYLMDDIPSRKPVTCEIGGKTYRGTYWVAGKILTVSTGRGGKSKQAGSASHLALAQRLLGQLAAEGKA